MVLIFATHNRHKAVEIQQVLGPAFEIKTLSDIGCDEEIPETADTLEDNALLKARFVKEKYGYDCFSEDTGLEVEALDGAPGVITARFAGEQKDPHANMQLLLEKLAGAENRRAQFRTVIALVHGSTETLLEGVCKGNIATAQSGSTGFGYDPVFVPDGFDKTFAELGSDIKNKISHRAKAVAQLKRFLV